MSTRLATGRPESTIPQSFSIPRAVWLIAALAVASRLLIAHFSHATHEDFLITLRYAENFARGHGFVYNPGERVLGTTTPLYTLILAAAAWAHLPVMVVGKALNILADGALCLTTYLWLQSMNFERAGRIAAFWIAICPLHVRWSVTGMESSLVAFLGTCVWLFYSRGRFTTAFGLAGILFLFRWDSLLLTAVLTCFVVGRDRAVPVHGILLFACFALPWLAFATWYFGNPIPITAAAKSTVYGWRAAQSPLLWERWLPHAPDLARYFAGPSLYTPLTILAIVGLVHTRRSKAIVWAAPVVWFVTYWSAFLASKVLLFPWYLIPPLPVFEALAAIGFVRVTDRIVYRRKSPLGVVGAWSTTAVVAAGFLMPTYVGIAHTQHIEDHVRVPLALWLRDNSSAEDTILLEPIGYVGYYSGRPILDMVGLVSPKVLRFYRRENPAPVLDMIQTFRPEWCVLRPGERARIDREATRRGIAWHETYSLIKTFSYSRDEDKFEVFRREGYVPPAPRIDGITRR